MAYQKKRAPSRGRRAFGGKRPTSRRGPKKENIHPSKFIKAAKPVTEGVHKITHTFTDFDVAPVLHKNIVRKGFTAPSPIQDQAIPVGLKGSDVIGIANTGTGKTVAFAIPVLQHLLTNPAAKVLIMAPTRELAHQILEEFRDLMVGTNFQGVLLIGGAAMRPQLTKLKAKPRIVIGTPGRIKDHLEKKSLKLFDFDTVVLDEVDRMLDMGFVGDMRIILKRLAHERQSFFFSATMDAKVRELINEFSHDPVTVSVKTGDTSDAVEQNIVLYASREDKIEKLHELLIQNKDSKVLIFDETKRGVEKLNKELGARGFKSDAIHGNKSQGQRQRALAGFKDNKTQILVATDVAARGIDVPDITHVINYATPQNYADYVHRIGRAGRAGRAGHALTFIEGKDRSVMRTQRTHGQRPQPQRQQRSNGRRRRKG